MPLLLARVWRISSFHPMTICGRLSTKASVVNSENAEQTTRVATPKFVPLFNLQFTAVQELRWSTPMLQVLEGLTP